MMRPEAFRFRANTGNTNFGFEQVLDDREAQQPLQPITPSKQAYAPQSSTPEGDYKFRVAGNRGALRQPVPQHKFQMG